MRQRVLLTSALALASLLLSVGLLEFGLRASGRFPRVGLHSVSTDDYDRIPGFWEPGQDFVNRENHALPHRIRINSLGLRGPETTLVPHMPRVLCLGDSFTFGDYVNDEETLPAQLGNRFAGIAEVLNGGVGGTTIVDQREFLKRYLSLRPDVVVLVYFDNDLEDLLVDPPMHVRFTKNRRVKSGVLRPVYELVRDTATFNAFLRLQSVLRALEVETPLSENQLKGDAPPVRLAPLVKRYADEVVALRNLLEIRGVGLVVAAFPAPYFLSGEWKQDRIALVSEALARHRIHMVDLTRPLRASALPLTELFLLPHDGHPSSRGYAIAADALRPIVQQALAARRALR
jgi:lysophospholipase L1-like esterase